MKKSIGERLTCQLQKNPEKFFDSGTGYQLLQAYFDGYNSETLRLLLTDKNIFTQRVAVWIASELGFQACHLLDSVLPLFESKDRYVKYHVLEIVAVCSQGENISNYLLIIKSLEDDDPVIRKLAMSLISNEDKSTLNMIAALIDNQAQPGDVHKNGLNVLANSEQLSRLEILNMINDEKPIIRKYGIMVAKKVYNQSPDIIREGMASLDTDISQFSLEVQTIQSSN